MYSVCFCGLWNWWELNTCIPVECSICRLKIIAFLCYSGKLPHAFCIPVALTSKVLTVDKQNSARPGFPGGDMLHPAPSRSSTGSPATWLDCSFAGTPSFHPSSAAKSDPDWELKMVYLCAWISSNTINLSFIMQCIWVHEVTRYRQPFFFFPCYIFQLQECKLLSKTEIFSCSPQVML